MVIRGGRCYGDSLFWLLQRAESLVFLAAGLVPSAEGLVTSVSCRGLSVSCRLFYRSF
jgi:hypothetical protein